MLERKVAARNEAISLAQQAEIGLCTKASPNFVVLEPDSDDAISVYLLSAQTDSASYPLGGHYLYRVDRSGKVVSDRKFMNTCMDIPTAARAAEGNPVGFVVTHILDNHLTEIHHFVAHYTDLALTVSAGGNIWTID